MLWIMPVIHLRTQRFSCFQPTGHISYESFLKIGMYIDMVEIYPLRLKDESERSQNRLKLKNIYAPYLRSHYRPHSYWDIYGRYIGMVDWSEVPIDLVAHHSKLSQKLEDCLYKTSIECIHV